MANSFWKSYLILLFLSFPIYATIVEISVHPKGAITIEVYLPQRWGGAEDGVLQELANAMKTHDWLRGEVLPCDKYNCKAVLRLVVDDWEQAADSVNFVDFKYTPSFFQEKFYLKLMINDLMLQSDLFQKIDREDNSFEKLFRYFDRDKVIELFLLLPGSYQQVENLIALEDGRLWNRFQKDSMSRGKTIAVRSRRLLPEIYISIAVVLLMIVGGIAYLYRG